MSLGVKSLWRARGCTIRVKGLSLIPREQHNSLFLQSNFQRWLSTPAKEAKEEKEISLAWENLTDQILQGKSSSSFVRAVRKQIVKRRSEFQPKDPALVKPLVRYPIKRESHRSLRNHRKSAATQHLYDSAHEADSKPPSNWLWTLNYMLQHTLDVREILNFRVIIAKAVAHEVLSEPDTQISRIFRRNECIVQTEEVDSQNGELVINLSGSEDSVRKSLLDIIKIVGTLTAVRLPDLTWETLPLDVWKGATAKRPEIRLLDNGEVVVDDRPMVVETSFSNSAKYKDYILTRRVDEINPPAEWTKVSFEKYVAALVHGQVPTYLARTLYSSPPNHQETVVSLLVSLFTSEHTKSAISLSALKMAVSFIESRGSGFREASWSIYNRVESLNLPMDAEIFNIFLVSSSKAKNFDVFNRILLTMVRKGFAPQSRAWIAFMELVQNPAAKRNIAVRLKAKGLIRNPSLLRAVGRQMATIDLERQLSTTFDITTFVDEQTKKYGVGWLDSITLNKIVHILGAHGQVDTCNALLDLVYTKGIGSPSVITLNTMLTHTEGIAQQIAILQSMSTRWPRLTPDSITYHLLFRVARKRRLPNTLRVIWRYAVLVRLTGSKMRYALTALLQGRNINAQRALLKAWEGVIFGQTELMEMRELHSDTLKATHFIHKYIEEASGMKPSVKFATKLEEALAMDKKIHRLLKEGTVMSDSMRESLSVDIPLEPEPVAQTRTSNSRSGTEYPPAQDNHGEIAGL